MLDVLGQSLNDSQRRGKLSILITSVREALGLLSGALGEHLRECFGEYQWFQVAGRRIHMRSEFRYSRATAPMMLLVLAIIIFAIYKARAVELRTDVTVAALPSVPMVFLVALFVAGLAGALGWLILHSVRRSGVHRLSRAQTWPQSK
jgi:predicted anti-sigma-YlaC factor YlaD